MISRINSSGRPGTNAIEIGYADEGKGQPVVFIHGFPLSRGAWEKQIEAFRASFRIIAPDLCGFGESSARAGAVSMSQFAHDVHELLLERKADRAVLVGHSMGGYVALAFALEFPQMLRGLVLVATRSGNDSPDAAAGRRATAEKVKTLGTSVVIDAMVPKMLAAANQDPKILGHVRRLMEPSKPEGVIGALLGMAERPDVTERLKSIAVPTLVITGAADVLIPPVESDKMAAAIPGAKLEVIPHAGHLVALEQPEAFNSGLSAWLSSFKLGG